MSIQSHVDHLKQRHRILDESIFDQQRRPGTDHLQIVSLKREKLRIKDEIERLNSSVH